jgi:hypothetical protein
VAAGGEGMADLGKMSTFVSAVLPVESRNYREFMYTFVYPVEKVTLGKSTT